MLYLKSFCILLCISIVYTTPLSKYNIDSSEITLSGISSGGCMCTQYHIAHSATIKGAAIIAGVPYWCANDNAVTAEACLDGVAIVSELVAATNYAALSLSIDSTTHLEKSLVWLFSGTKDSIVSPTAMKAVENYYQHYVKSSSQIFTEFSIPAEHSWVTNGTGNVCSDLVSPFVNNCTYDAAGNLLKFFYGNLNPPVAPIAGNLLIFDQSYYTPGITPASLSMDQNGYVYVPTNCKNGSVCKLHVVWHGCEQGYQYVQSQFIDENGLNNYAESNNIIVLYPQAIATALINPYGCWDWWGYTGTAYATKLGTQINAVQKMISALLGN